MNVEVYMGVYFLRGINMEANQKAGGQNDNDCYDENEKEAGAVGWLWRVLWLQRIVSVTVTAKHCVTMNNYDCDWGSFSNAWFFSWKDFVFLG